MKCDICEKDIDFKKGYIKFEGERVCSNCYTESTITSYFVGGEFLATDDDGVEEFGEYSGSEYTNCKHENLTVDKYGLSAYCNDCGFEPSGWYCPESPTLECEYYDSKTGYYDEDCCIYCGQPEERK